MEGHTKGLENFKVIVDYCREIGVKYTTFWALSTDNLKKREDLELQHLFKLLGDIRNYLLDFMKHEVQVSYIGDLTKLPSWLRTILDDVKAKTEKNNKFFAGIDTAIVSEFTIFFAVDSQNSSNNIIEGLKLLSISTR